MFNKILLLPALLIITFSINVNAQELPLYKTFGVDIDKRVEDLLQRLTLEEKASLMLHNNPAIERLGIPEYNWWNEALHGVGRAGKATVFPQAIGLAATFDKDLVFRVATAISDEARAKHNLAISLGSRQQYTGLTFWSPNVNIFRDPRWGRGQETYGEDPFLTSRIGLQFVKGMQGDNPDFPKTAACAKHFVVHSGPEKTRHEFDAHPTEFDLNETYLPAFKYLVENGVDAVMCAYNQLYSEPCCGNKVLLNDILREEWGFKGHIVSDCWALSDFISFQKIVDSNVEAATMSVKAGVNLNCGQVYNSIPEAVELGLITKAEIDDLLRPLLKMRFQLGLMDDPSLSPYYKLQDDVINSASHIFLANEAASKSIVLLKNDNVLPLQRDSLHKIFVTGPTAADITVLMGNYNGVSANFVTLLEGIVNRCDEGTVVDYTKGALMNKENVYHGIYSAPSSDVIIASIGNSRLLEGEEGDAMLSENGGDRKEIKLPESQIEFIRRLKKAAPDKPLIVVINGGSAIAIPEISELADAVLFAWYPGEQGGNAIADIIFGIKNPSGRLPVTFYEKLEDLPDFDDYSMSNRTYKYFIGDPLYCFGHGLSYSDFKYSSLDYDIKDNRISISLSVTNTSDIDGNEVVQLYVSNPESQILRSIKALKGFENFYIKANETKQVVFDISFDELGYWNSNPDIYDFVFEPGVYNFMIGASSNDTRLSKEIKLEIKK